MQENIKHDNETRFQFGRNWEKFLEVLDEDGLKAADTSLIEMLEVSDLEGVRFLDIGSGSGLFSLAARNLGAEVHSFDYDHKSVSTTEEIKRRYRPNDQMWEVEQGDVLDKNYLKSLGNFDIVYSWGVLHHTGEMWTALENAAELVKDNGKLFIAIYNDQRWLSRYWKIVKRLYNKGVIGQIIILGSHAPYFLARMIARRFILGSKQDRGMNGWRNMFDWLGGYPFEVARPEEILEFLRARKFVMEKMITVDGRLGCNEFVLRKINN